MRYKKLHIVFCLLLLATGLVAASQSSDEMYTDERRSPVYNFQAYYNRLYQSSAHRFAFAAKTKGEFAAWKRAFLPALKQSLGLVKLEEDMRGYELKAELKEKGETTDFIFQKWFLWTEPDVPLPVMVLMPKGKGGKLPAVIATHGHGRDSILYDGIYPRIQRQDPTDTTLLLKAVGMGSIAIAPTMRAFGSTRFEEDIKAGNSFSCHTQLMRDLLVGRTVIGDRVWDVSKVLDWALKNLPIDEDKVAITGNSGGGTVALFAAACDDRIKVAVPSSYFNTFTGSLGSIAHCDCNYIPGILNLGEMSDIAGLIAPRPLRMVHGVEDNIYPIGETRKAFSALKNIYTVAGKPGNVELFEGPEGHKYYHDGSWPFIKEHFDRIR